VGANANWHDANGDSAEKVSFLAFSVSFCKLI